MKTGISKIEKEILEFWKKRGIFEKSLKQRKGRPIFSFYDGPPFATGLPHYGHILASTIKDVVPRYWAMKGYYVPRRWGWDCHGLPIENIVEKKLKISGKKEIEKIGIGKFNDACRRGVLRYAKEWGETVDRIGRFVDFENAYRTMDNDYIESVWWALKELWKKGLVYEGRKVLLYCPRCECPISNFEVAMDNSYKEVVEESVVVKFKSAAAERLFGRGAPPFFLAWTTTPWTLPANAALAVSKKLDYVLARSEGGRYVLAEAAAEKVLGGKFETLKKFKGGDLAGIEYEPLYAPAGGAPRPRVLTAGFVEAEEGTGIVHIAPAYGEEDCALGKKFGLPMAILLDSKGRFGKAGPPFVRGKRFKEAEKPIKDDLERRKLLYKREKTAHSYPFCWRCETELFYSAVPAWFINVQKLKKKLVKLNKGIGWRPAHLKQGRFLKGIRSAPDWTISRNRYWASPIPVWKCGKCGNKKIIGSKSDLLKQKFSRNRYFVLRHGQTAYQNGRKGALYPAGAEKSVELSQKGEKTIRSLAEKAKDLPIGAIYASPALRARQTAEIMAEKFGLKVEIDRRLRDIDLGVYAGRPKKELSAGFPGGKEALFSKPPEKGESWNDCRKRMLKFIRETDKKRSGQTILIVSHGDPLWLLEGAMSGLSRKELLRLKESKKTIRTGELREIAFRPLPLDGNGEFDFHRPRIDRVKFFCRCGELMERVPEVLDCWVESASMPFAEIHYPFENKAFFKKRFPAHFVAEYIAQTRAWFYVSHVLSSALFGKAPFKNVVATGTILNEKGEKLSKSKKNFPDPHETLEKYGADALRLYLMSSSVMKGEDLFFSERELKDVFRKNILTLMNIVSFYKLIAPAKPARPPKKPASALDRWILSRLNRFLKEEAEKMDNYEIVPAARAIGAFIGDVSLWYLRRSRGRLKAGDKEGAAVFGHILLQFSKAAAPFAPFAAERVYAAAGGKKESVHLENFPKPDAKMIDAKLERAMELARRAAALGLKARSTAGIKVRQPLSLLKLSLSGFRLPKELLGLVKEELNVKKIETVKRIKKGKGLVVESEKKLKAALDVKITPKLKREGALREIIRRVQAMRKKAGLKPKDKISIYYSASGFLADVLEKSEKKALKELKAEKFEPAEFSGGKFLLEKKEEIGGNEIRLGIKRAEKKK